MNVLVTGTGSIIGYGIVESLRKSAFPGKIISTDIYPDAYGRYISDDFVVAELTRDASYPGFLERVIDENQIDLIFPGIEQDMIFFHENRELLQGKVKVVLNTPRCVSLCMDKLETYQYLSQFGVELIPTLTQATYEECRSFLSLPFLMKATSGNAGKGIYRINNELDFEYYHSKLKGKCICQRIVGNTSDEYTISVFGNGKGGYFDWIILRRELSREGATSKAEVVDHNEVLMDYITRICDAVKPEGPTNIQLRMENGRCLLLEINSRISSACSIRTAMGYNEPAMCVDYYLHGKDPVRQPKRKGRVVRYIADHVIYE